MGPNDCFVCSMAVGLGSTVWERTALGSLSVACTCCLGVQPGSSEPEYHMPWFGRGISHDDYELGWAISGLEVKVIISIGGLLELSMLSAYDQTAFKAEVLWCG